MKAEWLNLFRLNVRSSVSPFSLNSGVVGVPMGRGVVRNRMAASYGAEFEVSTLNKQRSVSSRFGVLMSPFGKL